MPCKLSVIDGTSDLEAAAGETALLFIKNHIGITLMAAATYAGQDLVPEGEAVSELELLIAPGQHTLKIVFASTASISSRAELREDCEDGDSTFLRALMGSEPLQIIRIFGR